MKHTFPLNVSPTIHSHGGEALFKDNVVTANSANSVQIVGFVLETSLRGRAALEANIERRYIKHTVAAKTAV